MPELTPSANYENKKRYALKVTFSKEKDMIYFSQLDLFRLFMRALRRANLPIVYTCGFNPHPKMSFSNAIKLGKEGIFETIFYLQQELNPEEFKQIFSKQIPPGLRMLSVESVEK